MSREHANAKAVKRMACPADPVLTRHAADPHHITDALGRTMFSVEDLAKRWDCSMRHVRRMADAGRIPRPIKLGALIRWSRSAIEQWESDGCPNVRNANKGGQR